MSEVIRKTFDIIAGVDEIQETETFTIPERRQMIVHGTQIIDGLLIIKGTLILLG